VSDLSWTKERAALWGVTNFKEAQRLLAEPPHGWNYGRKANPEVGRDLAPENDDADQTDRYRRWNPLNLDLEEGLSATELRIRVAFPYAGWHAETVSLSLRKDELRKQQRYRRPMSRDWLDLLVVPRLNGFHLDDLRRSLTVRRRNPHLQSVREHADWLIFSLASVVSTDSLADYFGCEQRTVQNIVRRGFYSLP
jgi:hypothetical protein